MPRPLSARPVDPSGWVRRSPRRRLAAVGLLLAAALGCGGTGEPGAAPAGVDPAPGARPAADVDLLLVTIDTLRADRIGAAGDAAAQTPAIDRLAAAGTLVERAYSSVPLTLPSHASLFTGRWPHEHGVRNNGSYVLGTDALTLAERLAAAGRETGAFVASYVLSRRFGLDQGFSRYDDRLADPERVRDFRSEIPATTVVERFEEWLGTIDAGRPFFAWLHFYEPHRPWEPPGDLGRRFAADPYRGEVAAADRALGRALAALETAGRRDRTLVVVTSDHGEGFGEHVEVGHGVFAYEEMLRVPLVLAGPGVAAGRRLADRVRLVDLAPTLLEVLGLPGPEDAAGVSFAPRLVPAPGPEPAGGADPEVYFESVLGAEDNGWAPVLGVIEGGLKYVALPEPELYDLAADPGEAENLAADRRGDLRRLDARLRELLLRAAPEVTRRSPDAVERAALEALGYAGTGSRGDPGLDPKVGMRIDRDLREVQDLLAAERLDEAERRLAAVRAGWPGTELVTMWWLEHGIAAARGDEAAAVAALEAGRRRFPGAEQLDLRLARYLVGIGRAADGEAVARELLAAAPTETRARVVVAEALAARGERAAAAAEYRAVLAAEPTNAPVALAAAELLAAEGRWVEARELLASDALEARPDDLFRAGFLAERAGDSAAAEDFLRRGLEVAPSGQHRLALGLLLARSGRADEARREIGRALDEHGDELPAAERRLAEGLLEAHGEGRP